jgi:transcriptional regulator with XRE-family HTH domain
VPEGKESIPMPGKPSTPDSREGRKPADEIPVGKRLRELRASRDLSMHALADASGLNVNTLSLIENQRTSPSVSTLQQLSQALQVPLSAFFEVDQDNRQVVFQKMSARPRASFSHGTIEDMGAGMSRFGAEPLIVTLDPHADSGKTPIVHTGREFVYCLEGRLAYTVGDETYLLDPGDSLLFDAYLPHRWKNVGSTRSRNLLILCPSDERERPVDRHFQK